ncbi:unnamed protein product, partial [Prorocentrum cordatum]
ATPEERLPQKAQQLRQLQAQQGRLKNQPIHAAQTQKDLETKLRTNIDECLAQQAQQAEDEGFPELGSEEMASLDETTRKQYEEASAAHKKARTALKSATDAGKAADADKDQTKEIANPAAVDFTNAAEMDLYISQMKSGHVDVLFANVTHYGEKVRHDVEHCNFDMIGLAEHHLLPKAAKQEATKLRFKGWQSQYTWTPATSTKRSTT